MSYTKQQIQDFCKTAEHTAQYNRMPTLDVALQIIGRLTTELAAEQEKNERPRKVQLFRLCSKCNKEFEVETSIVVPEFIQGVATGRVSSLMPCPHCKERNDIWVRVLVTEGE